GGVRGRNFCESRNFSYSIAGCTGMRGTGMRGADVRSAGMRSTGPGLRLYIHFTETIPYHDFSGCKSYVYSKL
ncbi:hypothetical protein, partial [Enterocloster clostridioformis]|uniref:hypothetical protein n=1 Tax=Enterocloster clostridioformis TaxID=1531 RepID=UPI001A9BF463